MPQLAAPLSVQRPSGVLFASGLHMPVEFCRLQATHAGLQALLQQTPCAQWPLVQSPLPEHCAPFGFSPHEPLVQTLPAEQSASAVQVALQTAVPHLNGTHDVDIGVGEDSTLGLPADHASDADMLLGDNGNIIRRVKPSTSSPTGDTFYTFVYD